MPRKQADPDAELRKKYGGAGAAGKTAHDTFIDVMSGKEKSVADWRKEIAPMKTRADARKREISAGIAQRTAYGRKSVTRRR